MLGERNSSRITSDKDKNLLNFDCDVSLSTVHLFYHFPFHYLLLAYAKAVNYSAVKKYLTP